MIGQFNDYLIMRENIQISDIGLPDQNRQKTDTCCAISYIFLTYFLTIVTIYGLLTNSLDKLLTPKDSDGRRCGIDLPNHPYIYFPTPFLQTLSRTVCVKECPSGEELELDCVTNSMVKACKFDMVELFNRSAQFIIYPTTTYQTLSLCRPISQIIQKVIQNSLNVEFFFSSVKGIYDSRFIILIGAPSICLVLMCIFLVCIRISSTNTLRTIVIMFFVGVIWLGIHLIVKRENITGLSRVFGILILILVLVLVILAVKYYKSVWSAFRIMKTASYFINSHNWLILLFILKFMVWALCFMIWVACFFIIYSISNAHNQVDRLPYLTNLTHNVFIKICLYLQFIHLVWTTLIINHAGTFLVCGTSSSWLVNKTNVNQIVTNCDLWNTEDNFKSSWKRLIRFHYGSVVLGSILISFFSWLTFLGSFLPVSRYRKNEGCWGGFMRCIHRFISFYSEETYTAIYLEGNNFFEAGRTVSEVTEHWKNRVSNALRFAYIINFMTKIVAALITTILCFFILKMRGIIDTFITNLFTFILGYLMASFASGSFESSLQSVLTTYLHLSYRNIHLEKNKIFEIIEDWFLVGDRIQKEQENRQQSQVVSTGQKDLLTTAVKKSRLEPFERRFSQPDMYVSQF